MNTRINPANYMTIKEACTFLHMSLDYLRLLISQKKVRSTLAYGRRFIPREEVERVKRIYKPRN
jgi:excisionase family DNA binding protein